MNLGELEGSEEKNRQYTQDDFLYTTAPYEAVSYTHLDVYKRQQMFYIDTQN